MTTIDVHPVTRRTVATRSTTTTVRNRPGISVTELTQGIWENGQHLTLLGWASPAARSIDLEAEMEAEFAFWADESHHLAERDFVAGFETWPSE